MTSLLACLSTDMNLGSWCKHHVWNTTHHLLLSGGLSDGQATVFLLALALMSGAAGVAAHWLEVPECVQFYAFLVLFGGYCLVTDRLWKRQLSTEPPGAVERRRVPLSES